MVLLSCSGTGGIGNAFPHVLGCEAQFWLYNTVTRTDIKSQQGLPQVLA
jgi:hypothetical protein